MRKFESAKVMIIQGAKFLRHSVGIYVYIEGDLRLEGWTEATGALPTLTLYYLPEKIVENVTFRGKYVPWKNSIIILLSSCPVFWIT